MLFHREIADSGPGTSSARTSFIQDEAVNQRVTSDVDEFAEGGGNSDYESDPAILDYDLGSEQETGSDIEHDSDSEDVSRHEDKSIPCSQQTIPDAGKPIGDVTGYEELNQAMSMIHEHYFVPSVTSIWLAGLYGARYRRRGLTITLAKAWVVWNADHFGPPTHWKSNLKLWTHSENICHGPRPRLRAGNI